MSKLSTLIAVILILALVHQAQAKIVVGISADYTVISQNLIRDTFTLTFKNTGKNTTTLNVEVPLSLFMQNVTVRDIPHGYMTYKIEKENGEKILLIKASKPLSPFEKYKIVVEGNIRGFIDVLGNGMYRFTAVEYPNYFNSIGIPVDSIHITINFPQTLLYSYRVTSVSSNSQITYNMMNSVERVDWDFINPTGQVVAFVQFQKVVNIVALDIIAGIAIFVAFVLLFYLSYRSEKKYRKMKILFSTPWGGNVVTAIREMLGKAEREVLITSPHIYYTDWLTAELKPAVDRGVKVRIITWPSYERRVFRKVDEVREDRKQFFTLKRFLEMFPNSVRLNDNIHAKMIVVDEEDVLITTANLTQTGLWENYEVGFRAENKELAEQAKNFFEMVWNADDTIELNETTVHAKEAWSLIMEMKKRRERERERESEDDEE